MKEPGPFPGCPVRGCKPVKWRDNGDQVCCGCLRHSSVSLRAPLSERDGTLPLLTARRAMGQNHSTQARRLHTTTNSSHFTAHNSSAAFKLYIFLNSGIYAWSFFVFLIAKCRQKIYILHQQCALECLPGICGIHKCNHLTIQSNSFLKENLLQKHFFEKKKKKIMVRQTSCKKSVSNWGRQACKATQ